MHCFYRHRLNGIYDHDSGFFRTNVFRYGFRDWQGKRFPECELNKFTPMQQGTQQSAATATSEPTAAEVASDILMRPETKRKSGEADWFFGE